MKRRIAEEADINNEVTPTIIKAFITGIGMGLGLYLVNKFMSKVDKK